MVAVQKHCKYILILLCRWFLCFDVHTFAAILVPKSTSRSKWGTRRLWMQHAHFVASRLIWRMTLRPQQITLIIWIFCSNPFWNLGIMKCSKENWEIGLSRKHRISSGAQKYVWMNGFETCGWMSATMDKPFRPWPNSKQMYLFYCSVLQDLLRNLCKHG